MTIRKLIKYIYFDLEESVLEVYKNSKEVFNSTKSESLMTLNEVLRKKYINFYLHKDDIHYGDKDVLSVDIN